MAVTLNEDEFENGYDDEYFEYLGHYTSGIIDTADEWTVPGYDGKHVGMCWFGCPCE